MFEDDKQFDRRTVLKALGSTTAIGAGLGAASGSAAAIETKRRLTRSYSDESRLRAAFQKYGQRVRSTLVEAGFVPADFEFDALDLEPNSGITKLEPAARDGLAGVTATYREDTPTALGMASTSSETHEIALFVQPEREEAYALVESRTGNRRLIVTESSITPSACAASDCTSCCDKNYRTKEYYECNPDCESAADCWLTGTDCACYEDACA